MPAMKTFQRIFLSSVLTVAFSAGGLAQGTNTLQGKVITPNGSQPGTPVKITLTFNGRRIYETFTDLSGRFSFPGVARGTYQLTAEGDGQTFENTSVYAEVSAFGAAPQLFTQDIQLRPIGRVTAGRAGVVNAFVQDVPKAARQAFERAVKLTDAGNADAAAAKLQEAIQIFPQFFEAHLALGNHFLKTGFLDKAISELDRAREVNPKDERLYQSFGLILMQQKNYQVAVAIFAEASRLSPDNPINVLMRGTALIHQASVTDPLTQAFERKALLSKAELALSEAYDLSGKKLKADHVTLALFYELKGEANRAADELEEYLRKTSTANPQAIQGEIKRLRIKANSKSLP
jgi:tetratricopeptide (TPR) repeat protein